MNVNHEPQPNPPTEARQATEATLESYSFRLYVAKHNPRSTQAIKRLRQVCASHLGDRYTIEIIDIHEHPEMLEQDQVFAIPTLIKQLPLPVQRIIGDLADIEEVILYLDL
jgi:circadian clock protein KaiB